MTIWVILLIWIIGVPLAVVAGVILRRTWVKRRPVAARRRHAPTRRGPAGAAEHATHGAAAERAGDARA